MDPRTGLDRFMLRWAEVTQIHLGWEEEHEWRGAIYPKPDTGDSPDSLWAEGGGITEIQGCA